MRSSVATFAIAMETKLQLMEHKGDWKRFSVIDLFRRVQVEVEELRQVVETQGEVEDVLDECVDVANQAMFIYDKLRDEVP